MTEQSGGTPPTHSDPQLPPSLVIGISVVLTGLFVLNIVADIFVKGYSGYPTTALLGVLVGSVLGIERYLRIGGGR